MGLRCSCLVLPSCYISINGMQVLELEPKNYVEYTQKPDGTWRSTRIWVPKKESLIRVADVCGFDTRVSLGRTVREEQVVFAKRQRLGEYSFPDGELLVQLREEGGSEQLHVEWVRLSHKQIARRV
jgi:hypothetical protein